MKITDNMHGTHEVHKLSPENLTEFSLRVGYRAFDAYFIARLGYDLAQAGINRNEIWLQLKNRQLEDSSNRNSYPTTPLSEYSIASSLLNTDYIDTQMAPKAKWQDLENVYRTEKLNYLGVEHSSLDEIKYLVNSSSIKPVFLQAVPCNAESLRYYLENAMVVQGGLATPEEARSNIATHHNVTSRQVYSKFLVQMGLQHLSGGHSEAHVRENAYIDFQLTPSEMKQLISASNEPEALLSIYNQLQDKTLMKLQDIITSYSEVKEEELPALLAKIGHYIAKLDPTSLSQIIADQDAFIIDTLIEYGANFSEITSYAYVRIINAHGIEFIDVLKEKLQILPEKLLVASLNSDYFVELFASSDLNKLSKNDILQIVKTYPDKIEDFAKANIAPETLLLSYAILDQKQDFDALLNHCDLNKLTNLDLVKIINNLGSQIVSPLYEKGVNFAILTSNDLNILVQSHGIEMARALAEAKASAGLLVPAMKLGGVEVFDELMPKVKISEFANHRLIKEIVQFHPENLSKLIKNGISLYSLIMATKSIDDIAQKIFDILVTDESMDYKSYNDFVLYGIDSLLKTPGLVLFKASLEKADLSKLCDLQNEQLLNKALDNGQVEYLDVLTDKMDLAKLYESYAVKLLTQAIDRNDMAVFAILADKMDLAKLYESDAVKLLTQAIDRNDMAVFAILANKLNIFGIETYLDVLLNALIDSNEIKYLEILADKINFSKLYDYKKIKLTNKIIDNGQEEYLKILANKMELSKLDDGYKLEIIDHAVDTHDIAFIRTLLGNEAFLTKIVNTLTPYLLKKIATLNDTNLFDDALSKISLIGFRANHFAYIMEDNCLKHDITTEKCTSITSEIPTKSDIATKKAALSDLFTCFNNEECLKQCLIEDLPSYAECYGKVSDLATEL